ncbi:hypothetical protein J1N35_002114 [Gossypium stocksii]|uniref:DUF4218 domain-containing protein n=1 Tax=Gossypium stocksii TaxID=47602 RepID=A0A9D3WKQ8_9ROSI|nr:hypothetical protein J1N35_002114 [Gossypium stocksii]
MSIRKNGMYLGSIAEGYLAEECMTFCSRYLEDVEIRLNRPSRNFGLNDPNLAETYLFQSYGEPISKVEIAELDDLSWIQAHRYVWSGKAVSDEVKWLSQGLNQLVKRYSAFIINGFRFHTKYQERLRRTKNCGIVVNSSITSYVSARDSNLVEGNVEYYGLLTDIIELDYYGKWKADVNTARGIKSDQFGFTMVYFSRLIHIGEQLIDEPYVFSSQVKQVFYSKDPTDKGKMRRQKLRDLTIVQNNSNSEEGNSEQQTVVGSSRVLETLHETAEVQSNLKVLGRSEVEERFIVEVSDDYIKKTLGKKWRDNKSTLKKQFFKKDISLEEKLRNVPLGMLRYQWEDMDRERVGTSSRQKQKFMHTVGSRSFARVAEAEEVSSGQKVGRLQLFDITHRKKDGFPMTSEAGEIMERLKEKKVEYEAVASIDSSVNHEDIDNKIITEVLGPERYGRV